MIMPHNFLQYGVSNRTSPYVYPSFLKAQASAKISKTKAQVARVQARYLGNGNI